MCAKPHPLRLAQRVAAWSVILSAMVFAGAAFAGPTEQAQRHGWCEDEITTGFHFYCDPDDAPPEDDLSAAPPPAPDPIPETPARETPPEPLSATDRIMAFRAELDEIKHRAVLEPTEENVRAYMLAQKRMTEMAGAFTDQWQRILFATPALDANIEFPLSALGSRIYQDDLRARREASLRKAATTRGLIFIFEDPTACPVCPTQVQIIANLRDKFDISVLPVTLDGSYPPELPETRRDEGQIAALGLADLPRPILGLVDPATGAVDLIGAGLLTEDHILERIHVLTDVPVGERY